MAPAAAVAVIGDELMAGDILQSTV